MTIQEAIKSEKPFRRKGGTWLFVTPSGQIYADSFDDNFLCKTYPASPYRLSADQVLASDWETKDRLTK